jgi:hypothetical protein
VGREKKVEKIGRRFLLLIIVLPGKNNSKINEFISPHSYEKINYCECRNKKCHLKPETN